MIVFLHESNVRLSLESVVAPTLPRRLVSFLNTALASSFIRSFVRSFVYPCLQSGRAVDGA